jgi:hypothetical protein
MSRATVTGPCHVFVAADPEMEASVRRPLLGLPIREAFHEPEFAAILDMYDFARCWGLRVTLDAVSSSGELGTIALTPDPSRDRMEVEWSVRERAAPLLVPLRGLAGRL